MIDVDDAAGRERLAAALGVQRWIDQVAGGGPYASVDDLVDAGGRAAADLTAGEIDEAVAHRPARGEEAGGDGTAVREAAAEQAGLGAAEEGVDAAIARGDEVYQQRFGRVFVISETGRSRQEVLDELQRRLKNDEDAETAETRAELQRIAALRLRDLYAGG